MEVDPIWAALAPGVTDLQMFTKKYVPELYLRPEVHPSVIEEFRIIKKVIQHSFFEYKFFEVAALKAVTTMEMALKLRFAEINNAEWPRKRSLQGLFKWFEENGYVEVFNSYYLESLRLIRNHLTHREYHGFGGPSTLRVVENIADLIDGLYEDTELRQSRMRLTTEIINCLDAFGQGLHVEDNQSATLAYAAWPAFIDNKAPSMEIHFYYRPLYTVDPKYLEGNQWVKARTTYFRASSVNITPEKLELKNADVGKLVLSPIGDEQDRQYFSEWWRRYENISQPTGTLIYKGSTLIDPFTCHLREFHKK